MSLNTHMFVFLSNQKMVIKGNNSCQEQCFMEIALLNVKTYQRKTAICFVLKPDLYIETFLTKCDILLIFSHKY